MSVAFVLSGGASLGSIQVGMALALEEAGIEPEMLVGTSVGALNGAWLAGGGTPSDLAEIWLGLDRRRLFPVRPAVGLRALAGRADHIVPPDGVRSLLHRHLPFTRLEEASVPLTVLATDARYGEEVVLTEGPAIQAILASAALPGIFPPVALNGRLLIDGGVTNNTPITTAIEAGATEVWVLSTGYSCALPAAPTNPLAMALHSIGLLVQQRLMLETRHRVYPVPVHLVPPPCPIQVTPIDLSHTDELIDRARRGTSRWLADGRPHALPLVDHPTHTS